MVPGRLIRLPAQPRHVICTFNLYKKIKAVVIYHKWICTMSFINVWKYNSCKARTTISINIYFLAWSVITDILLSSRYWKDAERIIAYFINDNWIIDTYLVSVIRELYGSIKYDGWLWSVKISLLLGFNNTVLNSNLRLHWRRLQQCRYLRLNHADFITRHLIDKYKLFLLLHFLWILSSC